MPLLPRALARALTPLAGALLAAACTTGSGDPAGDPTGVAAPSTTTAAPPTTAPPGSTTAPSSTTGPTATPTTPPPARPAWLGTRPLPLRPDGIGYPKPTPPELVDRRLPPSPSDLPPPPGDGSFAGTVSAVPVEVAARSTWRPGCPVGLDDLRYLTVTFWGFDERAHTGELIVHADVAEDVVGVFRRLYEARFPVEEMRVTSTEDLEAPPTGDGGGTGGFTCRLTTGGATWSEHARGLAVDVNPFHNPYVKGDLVVPELAGAYVDRTRAVPGMVRPGDVVTSAFADIGWHWGGEWRSSKDWMHFSASGR